MKRKKKQIQPKRLVFDKNGKQPVVKNKYQLMVWQLLKIPDDLSRGEWMREVKIGKELFEKYPDEEFWSQLDIGFHLNSLAFFKRKEGSEILQEARTKYVGFLSMKTQPKEKIKLENNKIGNDTVIQRSKKQYKDVFDFLDSYGKETK
tara:strand:- start:239 stop:682 length:444 start_codon:yes stop_codon:yes gene_type:complete